jgi:hypothetical protein
VQPRADLHLEGQDLAELTTVLGARSLAFRCSHPRANGFHYLIVLSNARSGGKPSSALPLSTGSLILAERPSTIGIDGELHYEISQSHLRIAATSIAA